MKLIRNQPAYRHHKARDCAVVTLNGKNHYLSPWQSPESHEHYARLIAEWSRNNGILPTPVCSPTGQLTISELILSYFRHAQVRYVKHGTPTSEIGRIRTRGQDRDRGLRVRARSSKTSLPNLWRASNLMRTRCGSSNVLDYYADAWRLSQRGVFAYSTACFSDAHLVSELAESAKHSRLNPDLLPPRSLDVREAVGLLTLMFAFAARFAQVLPDDTFHIDISFLNTESRVLVQARAPLSLRGEYRCSLCNRSPQL